MKFLWVSVVSLTALPAFGQAADDVKLYRKYIDGPYGQIHVRVGEPLGDRSVARVPLVMLHYSPGSSRIYEHVLPYLARDGLVVAFDTPGYGQSDAPSSQPSLSDYTSALMQAMNELSDARQFDVFGMLTGSLIAVDMAVRHKDRVRRLVLTNAPAFNDSERRQWLETMRGIATQREADWRGRWLVERLESNLARLEPGISVDHITGAYIDNISSGRKWIFGEIAALSYRADLAMPKITQPVGIITWESERSIGTDMSAATRRSLKIIPRATEIPMRRASYWPFQDQAKPIALAVREYLGSKQ